MIKHIGITFLILAFSMLTVLAENSITALESFEQGYENWSIVPEWSASTTLSLTDTRASDGVWSLALGVQTTGTGWQEAGISTRLINAEDWSSDNQLAVDVYVPEGAGNFIAQLFTKTSDSWTWANSADTALIPGTWTTVTASLSTLGDVHMVREYGIKVGTSSTAYAGQILIDNIRLVRINDAYAPTPMPTSSVAAISHVAALDDSVSLFDKVELVTEVDAEFSNPYDPADIRVDGAFTSPSGETVLVPGFYYRDFVYANGVQEATDDWSWRIRFTPTELGEWRYEVIVTTASDSERSDTGVFQVTDSNTHGFIRIDSRNPRYFAFEDGTPYFPIGENMAWATGSDPIGSYTDWIDSLAAVGGNYIRVWMPAWGFAIEWSDTGLGNYDGRQAQAFQLDRVLNLLSERDMYMMLTLINHGQFNTSVNPEWSNNPYNVANGGPCADPTCFATDEEAIRLWQQRLRYIVARWGYSPNIFAWEWWNEVNWTPLADPVILAPWMQGSADYLLSLDPNHHLITHSGSPIGDESIWGASHISFVQDHRYDLSDLPEDFQSIIRQWETAYPNKPFLMGEFGSPLDIDTQGVLLHLGLWSAAMNGAAGTGMTWWWDTYVDPLEQYDHFGGISAFFAGEDMGAHDWSLVSADFNAPVRAQVYGLQSEDRMLLWVVSRDYSNQYLQSQQQSDSATQFPPVEGATLRITNLIPGSYVVEVWDTMTGEILLSTLMESGQGSLEIALPSFTTDLALKVMQNP